MELRLSSLNFRHVVIVVTAVTTISLPPVILSSFICIFNPNLVDEDTDRKFLRNPNLNEITSTLHIRNLPHLSPSTILIVVL
jgi:hypothetical protein